MFCPQSRGVHPIRLRLRCQRLRSRSLTGALARTDIVLDGSGFQNGSGRWLLRGVGPRRNQVQGAERRPVVTLREDLFCENERSLPTLHSLTNLYRLTLRWVRMGTTSRSKAKTFRGVPCHHRLTLPFP